MAAPSVRPGDTMVPGSGRPSVIAHGAGNTRDLARQAITQGADYLEVDLWVHRGRFEARHERKVYQLPVLFEKWYLRFAPRRPVGLADLFEAAGSSAGMFLDLKNGTGAAAALIEESIRAAPNPPRLVASSQHWRVLREVSERLPQVDTYYSIDVPSKLDLFLSIADRDLNPRGVSCEQRLLTRPIVQSLKDRGLLVVAWTVDDIARAEELLSWGIDGVTTHRVAEVRRLVEPKP